VKRDAGGEAIAAVQSYIHYLQRLGVTELPVTLAPPVRTEAAALAARAAAPTLPAQGAVLDAEPAVRLAQLAAAVRDCRKCGLHRGRTQVVFGTGDPAAALVFVGEAPGHDEDVQGEPFVGAAGQLLNRIIVAIGLRREQVYILNIIKCRPPQNRNPQPDEIAACWPILQAQLACLRPRIICALGTFAAQTLLQTEERISRLRGRFHKLGDIQVMPTYHPAFLLRNAQYKRAVWEDMQLVQRALGLR
jgi:uracil-DNA glycosylase